MQVHSEFIDKAISSLTALRDRRVTTSVKCQEDELDGYYDAKGVLKDAHLICADLLIALSEIAAEAAGKSITDTDRRNFRDRHLIDDALYEADLWADELQDAVSSAPEHSTINRVQLGLTSPVASVR